MHHKNSEILKLANILVRLSGEKKKKRQRTSPEQLSILEQIFQGNRTPDYETRARLSKQLGMTPRRIQIWFQNKRAKMKKIQQEEKEEFCYPEDSGNLSSPFSPCSSDGESPQNCKQTNKSLPFPNISQLPTSQPWVTC